MDGNGRWAKRRYLPRMAGHREGLKTVHNIAKTCSEIGIEVLTLFAFSSENWRRPLPEVNGLMALFLAALQNEIKKLHQNNVQLRVIGDFSRFSAELRAGIAAAQQLTAQNSGLKLVIAADYGGRWDILQAVQKIAQSIEAGHLSSNDITAETFAAQLNLADLPAPDLFIRTSGEWRISNFLLWQMAYTELYFTDVLWPDFDEPALMAALQFYANCERRFGCTSEQVTHV
jgi:undecaprenyl diphosphate synthase